MSHMPRAVPRTAAADCQSEGSGLHPHSAICPIKGLWHASRFFRWGLCFFNNVSPTKRLSAICLPKEIDARQRAAGPGLHRFLQFLGDPEGNLLARLDLDSLTGRRVPTHPGCTLPHLEDAEAGQTDFVAPL
jgi:hypothetical protein